MRKLALALACALSLTAQAQVPVFTPQLLMPSPLGIVITVGQWIIKDQKQVYYIQVQTVGSTFEEARLNGFRLAVEQALGSVVLSETQTSNSRIVRDDIISYASGYVDKFEVHRVEQTPQGYRMTMDVWVGRSQIANRLLNDSTATGRIDGDRLAVQSETLRYERSQGDRVMATVLNDFPRRAFDVKIDRSQINFTNDRQLQIAVPITVSWNQDYVRALYEASRVVGFEPERCLFNRSCEERQATASYLNIKGRGTIVGWNGAVGFNDSARLGAIIQRVTQNAPAVQFTIFDTQGNARHQTCQPFIVTNLESPVSGHRPTNYMLTVADRSVTLNERYTLEGRKMVTFGSGISGPQDLDRVDVRVVDRADCTKKM